MSSLERPARVLHVTQPTSAGVAVCVRHLSTHQHRQGLDVVVACPDEPELPGWLEEAGVAHRTWKADRAPGIATIGEATALARIIAETDPDILHLHSSKAGLVGRATARGRRRTIFHPNAWSFLPPGPSQRIAKQWERRAARWTDLFIFASTDERDLGAAASIAGASVVIPNGVNTAEFAPASPRQARHALEIDDKPVAVCVGRLCEQKGQDLLLAAWNEVSRSVPDAQLILVGSGEWERRLRDLAAPSVRFVGNQTDVASWYQASDVAVQASRWEGLSFATLEALSVGRPVVAFDAPGMRQAVGDAGAVVAAGDTSALAAALIDRLADPGLAAAEGIRGAERARELFSVDAFCEAVTAATLELAGLPPTPQS